MKTVTFSQLRNNAKKYFDAVEQGETMEVYRHGKPVALISPFPGASGLGRERGMDLSILPEHRLSAMESPLPYAADKGPRLLEKPVPSGSRELLRDRGNDVIPISYTKRFIRQKFGALGTKGSLLKSLVKERRTEREHEDKKWRRRKKK